MFTQCRIILHENEWTTLHATTCVHLENNTEWTNQTLEDRRCLTPLLQNSKPNKMKHYIVEGYEHMWYTFLKAKEWETQNIG